MVELRKILSLMKKRKYVYILGIIGNACTETSIYIIISFVLRAIFIAGIHLDRIILIKAAELMGITTIITSVFYALFSYLYNSMAKQVMFDIRLDVYETVEKLPVSYFELNHSGDIVSRMTNDIQLMEQIYTQQIYTLVYTLIYGGTSALFMLFTDWKLTIIFLLFGVILLWLNSRMVGGLRILSKKIQEVQANLTSALSDLISGLEVIRIFHLEDIIYKNYAELNMQIIHLNKKKGNKNALIESSNFLMGTLSYVGIVAVGTFLAIYGQIEMDKVIGMTQLMMGVTFMFQQLGNATGSLQSSLAGAGRIIELLDEEVEPEAYKNLIISDHVQEAILIENLNFAYDHSSKVLEDINIKVKEGEVIALIGASGSGKSTLIKIILGFYEPTSGRIQIKSNGSEANTLYNIRNLISYVSQDISLFDGTIEENIKYGKMDANEEEIVKVCKAANAHEFIMEFENGYQTLVGENGSRLSGGQRQRIAIARALLKNSPIVLLDEATSALDTQTEQHVQKAVNELLKAKTAIVITHRLATIENADRIYVMDAGRIVECGDHEKLMGEKGIYAKLYQMQLDDS